MAYNLSRNDDGKENIISNAYYGLILEKARENGWEPIGTYKIDDDGEEDESWDSSDYVSNSGQGVSEEDAYALSDALKKTLEISSLDENEREIISEFIEWLFISEDETPGFEIY